MRVYFHAIWRRPALGLTVGCLACGVSAAPWALAGLQDGKDDKKAEGRTPAEAKPANKTEPNGIAMQV